jgi:hypothetical protein
VAEWSPERRKRQSDLMKRLHREGRISGGPKQRKRPDDVVDVLKFKHDGETIEIPVTREQRENLETGTAEQRADRVARIIALEGERAIERARLERERVENLIDAGFGGFKPSEIDFGEPEILIEPREDPLAEIRTDMQRFLEQVGAGGVAWFDAEGAAIPPPAPSSEFRSGEVAAGESSWTSRGAG